MNRSTKLLACFCACVLVWTQWPVQGCTGSTVPGDHACCCAPDPEPEPVHSCCADDAASESQPTDEATCSCVPQDVDGDLPELFVAPARTETCEKQSVDSGFTLFYLSPDVSASSRVVKISAASPPLHRCSVPAYLANCAFLC